MQWKEQGITISINPSGKFVFETDKGNQIYANDLEGAKKKANDYFRRKNATERTRINIPVVFALTEGGYSSRETRYVRSSLSGFNGNSGQYITNDKETRDAISGSYSVKAYHSTMKSEGLLAEKAALEQRLNEVNHQLSEYSISTPSRRLSAEDMATKQKATREKSEELIARDLASVPDIQLPAQPK